MDQDFVDYLIESVREIGGYDFVIRINLPVQVHERYRKRVRKSIKSYFRYLELLERRNLRKLLLKSLILFCLGMLLLTISISLKGNVAQLNGMLHELMSEGLTVAAWVSLWSSFAILIFEFAGIFSNIRIYRRIATREVIFKISNLSKTLHTDEAKEERLTGAGILRQNN